ncbi:MAG: hypothetical protein HY862_16615 [Chloroflexi bacterium]|nr:hypothetical protein [Chloroflexota bacterium]
MLDKRQPVRGEIVQPEDDDYLGDYDHYDVENRNGPIHPLSAMVTIALDFFWTVPDLAATPTVVGLFFTAFSIFVLNGIAVSLIQYFVERDNLGSALAKGFAMGIVAGVPYPLTGTIVGGAFLLPHVKRQLLGSGK